MDRGAGKGKQPMAPFESKESNDYETISGETLFGVPPNPIPDQNTHHIISCEYQQGKKPIKDRWLVHLGTEWLLVSTHDQEGYVTKAQMHYVREPFVTELGNYVKSQNLTGLRSLYDGMTQKELRLFANQVLNGKIANYHEDTEPCNCHLDIVTKDAAQGPKRNKTATLNEPSTSSLSRKRKSTQPIDAAFKRIKLSKKKQSPQRSKSVSEQSTVLVFSSGSNSESEEDQEEFVTQPEREDNPQGSSGLFTSRENNGSTLPNRSTSGFVKNLNPLYRQTRSKSQAALLTSQDIALPAEPGHSAIKLLPASKQVQKGQEVPNEHDACAFIFVLPKDFPDDAATRDLIIINQYSHAMETPEQVTSMEYIHFLEDVAAAIHRAYCPDGSGVPMPVSETPRPNAI
ncbi:hypothetical protein M8818_004158 [Zalaria obscura]|uniref:Uncharacterized protein n=1 Tax=Zalaria obscura TaxID=2024903 RepID=A0ACC3SD51_9PEZI